jgi:hypothetical protein
MFSLVSPWAASALVALATAASVFVVRYVYRRERHHAMSLPSTIILAAWFLFSFTVMAFLVRPH